MVCLREMLILSVSDLQCAQEKRSAYAPSEETPVRYDGIYRIARAYRKPGAQKQLVCRYLFVRCDNEPAPWSSEGEPPISADSTFTLDTAHLPLSQAAYL